MRAKKWKQEQCLFYILLHIVRVFYKYNVEIKLKAFTCIYELTWLIDICWTITIKSADLNLTTEKKAADVIEEFV